MKLGDKQRLFAKQVARLIDQAHKMGYEITLGDAFRDPRSHGKVGERIAYGDSKSCHKVRLAIDLNLFIDGKFQTTTKAHQPLGEWWEKQNEFNRWGGRFNDGNHYSMTHNGMS